MDTFLYVIVGAALAFMLMDRFSKTIKKVEPLKTEPEKERRGLGIGYLKEKCPPHAWAENVLATGERLGLVCPKCNVTFP